MLIPKRDSITTPFKKRGAILNQDESQSCFSVTNSNNEQGIFIEISGSRILKSVASMHLFRTRFSQREAIVPF